MTLFRLDASINPGQSASRAIADIVEAEWYQAHPGDTVIRRHVGTDPLPADAWAHAVAGARIPEADRSESQRAGVALAARLAGELADADAVLLAVPLYNFGVSQHIKTWIDLVIAAPRDGGGATGRGRCWRASRPSWSLCAAGPTGPGRRGTAGTIPPATCGASSPTCGVPS